MFSVAAKFKKLIVRNVIFVSEKSLYVTNVEAIITLVILYADLVGFTQV